MATLDYHYQSVDFTGKVLGTGKRLTDVEGMGERIIVDYKKMRYTIQPQYPAARYNWHKGFDGISFIIKREVSK